MMYPFLQMDDETEIVHSQMLEDGRVKVYFEQPVEGGFRSAACYLPDYQWREIEGFTDAEIEKFQALLESVAHLILRFAQEGGFDHAANL